MSCQITIWVRELRYKPFKQQQITPAGQGSLTGSPTPFLQCIFLTMSDTTWSIPEEDLKYRMSTNHISLYENKVR